MQILWTLVLEWTGPGIVYNCDFDIVIITPIGTTLLYSCIDKLKSIL